MFSKTWETSKRKYNILVERDVRIPMSDGTEISADVFRPDSKEKFPALLGMHAYPQQPQTAPIKPDAFGVPLSAAALEAGDPNFYVRRGYVQVIANVRGTGKSGGFYEWFGPREIRDIYEIIEWAAKQPWCSGKVSMFGVSYFAMVQQLVAALNPPSLKCLCAPWAPFHPHTKSEPLTLGTIYEFNIPIVPTGNLFKAGSRIKIKISCSDDAPINFFEGIAGGNICRQSASRITIYHDADHPSHLLLPITKGNVIGTYITGGKPYVDLAD
jgi:predicted acyl esterase